jgi:hypothetical protein
MKKTPGTAFKFIGVFGPDKKMGALNFTKEQREYIAALRKQDCKEGFINGTKLINN